MLAADLAGLTTILLLDVLWTTAPMIAPPVACTPVNSNTQAGAVA